MSKSYKNNIEFVKCYEYNGISKNEKNLIIVLDNCDQMPYCYVFKIYGEINKEITFLSNYGGTIEEFAYIDNDNILYMVLGFNLIKFDLNTDTLLKIVSETEWIHNFFQLEDGFLLHQEMSVKYFDKELNLLWEDSSCVDIFSNPNIEKDYFIGNNFIAIADWGGFKHFYNKNGKFKKEKLKK